MPERSISFAAAMPVSSEIWALCSSVASGTR